jgi:hypothetical protein
MFQRNEILETYLSHGGRVVISGLAIGFKIFLAYWDGWINPYVDLQDFFAIDSLYTYRFLTYGEPREFFTGASPVMQGYPSLSVSSDSSRVYTIPFFRLQEITAFAPGNNGDVLYEYVSSVSPSDSTLHGHTVGLLTSGEREGNQFATALISFPLYAMEPYDSVSAMVEQVLSDLDVEINGNLLGSSKTSEQSLIEYVYPNPSNMIIKAVINLPQTSMLRVSIFNIIGQEVAVIAEGSFEFGRNEFCFDGSGLSSGIYFIHASVPGKMNEVRKVVLMK